MDLFFIGIKIKTDQNNGKKLNKLANFPSAL